MGAYFLFLAAICLGIRIAGLQLAATLSQHQDLFAAWMGSVDGSSGNSAQTKSRVLGSDDEWMQKVRSGDFWRPNSGSSASSNLSTRSMKFYSRNSPSFEPSKGQSGSSVKWGLSGTYRTLCVRLCDGYYWPISFATSRASFDRDNEVCERSCSSGAKLYIYRNPGEEAEDMVDLNGQSYKALKTAFLYRDRYDLTCQCRPHPWQEAALRQHQTYLRTRKHSRKESLRVSCGTGERQVLGSANANPRVAVMRQQKYQAKRLRRRPQSQ